MFPGGPCQKGLQNYNHSWFHLILGPSLLFPSHLYGQVFPSASKREERELWTEMTRKKAILCKRHKLMWGIVIYTLKIKGASRCHKEPLTSEEPFCFTKGSLW